MRDHVLVKIMVSPEKNMSFEERRGGVERSLWLLADGYDTAW